MGTRWVIVGAGIAGAAAAWALARKGLGPGVILEREPTPGFHASGRNAALAHQAEADPALAQLAARSMAHLRSLDAGGERLLRPTGGVVLAGPQTTAALAARHQACQQAGVPVARLSRERAQARFPVLAGIAFDEALWSPTDGVLDIHELLTRYLALARETGFTIRLRTAAVTLYVEGGRVAGVVTGDDVIRADGVIDATGAWAGRLGRAGRALPLQPFRRHLFVTAAAGRVDRAAPYVWSLEGEFYFRPEGDGLLLSPCDETAWPAEDPPVDPAAVELLARKLARHAPGFVDLPVRRSWACLRTFAPDRRPLIGPDPDLAGLYHLSGLGGSGMTVSAAAGELLADLIAGERPDWIDPHPLTPERARQGRMAVGSPVPSRAPADLVEAPRGKGPDPAGSS